MHQSDISIGLTSPKPRFSITPHRPHLGQQHACEREKPTIKLLRRLLQLVIGQEPTTQD